MAYIYRKEIHGKPYFYLRVSKRVKGKQIVKDVAYLGSSLSEVEKKLEHLPAYQKEIRKSHKTLQRFIQSSYYLERVREKKLKRDPYITSEIQLQIEGLKLHYSEKFEKLDAPTREEVLQHFLIDFSFNTTSLEGNTITLLEAYKLLKEEILPKGHTLREVYDLQNTQAVFFALIKEKRVLSEETLIYIHDRLLQNIDERKGYRTHDIRVFKSRFETTPAKYVQTDMRLLWRWFEKNKKRLHPLVLAGIFHHKLEKIHPFADGNGRTGRMFMNLILLKAGYPPLIVPTKRRKEYLNQLRKADDAELEDCNPKEYRDLINYLAREMIESYWQNFNV